MKKSESGFTGWKDGQDFYRNNLENLENPENRDSERKDGSWTRDWV